ncbi:MAG: helix-turn-helix domain-containing protein, partial [Bdellovibrionales bacterium]
MITREQCRAARGLLGLKQTELAEACGVSKTAITNFESGIFNPRADTMAQIFQSFHKMGIEFIGDYGVQKRRNRFEVLDDPDALTTLWDDIFQTLKNKGGEVLISNLSEAAAFNKHPEKLKAHIERLKAHNITERLLVCEGDTFFIQDISCYRWLQKNIYRSGMT